MLRSELLACAAVSVLALTAALPTAASAQTLSVVGGTIEAPQPVQRPVTFAARRRGGRRACHSIGSGA